MSIFIKKAKHPKTGKVMSAYFIDNYFGSHKYGVGFRKDGKNAKFENVNFNTDVEFFREIDIN